MEKQKPIPTAAELEILNILWDNEPLTVKEIHEKLYDATTEITNQYTLNNNETKHLEEWLLQVFKNESIDGKNRYQAFVLLAFMYTNYNENDKLTRPHF